MNFKKILISGAAGALMFGSLAVGAFADSVGPINFESPYTVGNINGQQGWTKTGPYDVTVDLVSNYPNASGFGFGTQALRLSNAVTSGSFEDQTFSPGLSSPAGEATVYTHFDASFKIGSTRVNQQPGLFTSVSPDDGNGSRMSYVGFDDQSDGIHVIFYDVKDSGPYPKVATFKYHDVATIDRTSAHSIRFSIDFKPGPGNDIVKLYVDGSLAITGTTWEDYYRYDPEQTGNGNKLFPISKLLFREGGSPASTGGNGYLVDSVGLSSSIPVGPTDKEQCKKDGWSLFSNPSFKNQGDCISFVQSNDKAGKRSEQSFTASDSLYYNGLTVADGLYANGPITFNWDPVTGNITGGYWNEIYPAYAGNTYNNIIVGGTVSGNTVNLSFHRDADNYSFSFSGTLVDKVLTGQMAGPYYFTATGN